MNISLDYYTLKSDKKMGDGVIIPQGQKLILIKEEDGLIQFESREHGSTIFLWCSSEEVAFSETVVEDWSQEKINKRNRHINGEFL